jgi:hypothetical protein
MEMIERDISFETLAEVCGADITQLTSSSRGQLNAALRQLREAHPDLADLELALVIEDKAKAYRQVMPDVLLTPSALIKHWPSLEAQRDRQQAYPEPRDPYDCPTCDGLRLIPATDVFVSGYAPCPSCNQKAAQAAVEYRARMERTYGHRPKPPPQEMMDELGRAVGVRPRSNLLP